MKTLTRSICLLVIILVVMVSCEKEIEPNFTILGRWEHINDNYTIIDPHGKRNYRLIFLYTFNHDSTGIFYYESKSKDDNILIETQTNSFSFSTNNNILTLTSTIADSSITAKMEYIIEHDKLTLYHEPYPIIYKRK
jgi:hypothetical protein